MSITIPAREVRKDDAVTVTVTITAALDGVEANAPHTTSIYFEADGLHGSFVVDPDMPVEVERPDPDADASLPAARTASTAVRAWVAIRASEDIVCLIPGHELVEAVARSLLDVDELVTTQIRPEIDDRDAPLPEPEPSCEHCADMGCAKCVPDYAQMYSLAAALDRIFDMNPSDGIA